MTTPTTPSRRDLLRSGAAVAAGTGLAPFSSAGKLLRPGGTEQLKVGLIGCGGRGTGAAANALRADPNVKLVALADVFEDQLKKCHDYLTTGEACADLQDKLDIPPERRFVGFEAYKGVIENCDVVLLATSPHFRPLHVEAAVEAGRHLFVEKPVATDPAGLRRIRRACEKAAEKRLSIVSGLCYRYERGKQATIERIRDGSIGEIVALQTTYNASGLWHRGDKPEWSRMEYQMRNWLYYTWLSGDHIAEQHIHSLDKLAWAKGSYPVKATSSGGRAQRTESKYGNVYDHFNTVFEWEDGVRGFSSCRQWNGADTDVSDYVYGTLGTANIQRHRIESGAWKWRHRGEGPDDMYQNEHDALFKAIREDSPINNGEYMCESTLMAIMGRLSAYTGKTVTREQILNSKLDLSPQTYGWGEAPEHAIAVPGVTKLE